MSYWFPANFRERLFVVGMPCLLVGIGAFLVGVGVRSESRVCLQQVVSFIREIDFALHPDPAFQEFLLQNMGVAHDLCERGQRQEAEAILISLRSGLGV